MALVKSVSADKKNNSLELNEFIKMIARDIKRDATGSRDELLEAFRSLETVILLGGGWCPRTGLRAAINEYICG